MRLFWAVPLDTAISAWIAESVEPYRARGGVKWVAPGNLHFTLKFLGEVAEARVPEIEEAGRSVAARHAPFALELGPAGALPHYRSPRVLIYRLARGAGELERLAGDIDRSHEELGFEREARAFLPHLTIGRIREGRRPQSGEVFRDMPSGVGRVQEVGSFRLVSSRLTPRGPIYRVSKEIALAREK